MRLSLINTTEYKQGADAIKHARDNRIAFKGTSRRVMVAVSKALDKSPLLTSYSQKFDAPSVLKLIRTKIGNSADLLFRHINRDVVIGSNIAKQDGKIQFRNKKPLRLLLDGLLYPVAKIPFYVLYGFTNFLKKFNTIKNSGLMKKFEKSEFYKITHSYLKKDDKLNALQGLMELGDLRNVMGSKMRAKSFLQSSAKSFDPKCGNYNGVNERALTRIVTGFIPAFFLANDAHNLSILCNNNKKEAQTEKKLRFNQESRRVLSNAYIQLITLGALSKFINKSKGWFVGVTVGTVLLTEIYSRLRTGKKIHFISPEEARAINMEERQKKMQGGLSFVLDEAPTPFKVGINSVDKFIEKPNANKFREIVENAKKNEATPEKEKSRSIMNLSTVLKYSAAVIAAGFAIKGLKKLPLGKGSVGDIFSHISDGFSRFYKKITMTSNHMSKQEINDLFAKMEKCGFGKISESYKSVVMAYQKAIELPKHITKELIEAVKNSGNEALANRLELFSTKKGQKELLKALKQEKIDHNFKVLMNYLQKKNETGLISEISKINADGKLNYPKLHKLFGKKENEAYREIFENAFSVEDNALQNEFINGLKKSFKKSGLDKTWAELEQKVANGIASKDYYDFGMKKIPVLKDAVDFCREPFKFLWWVATLPYNGVMKVVNLTKVNPRKAASDIDAVTKALGTLKKKAKLSDSAFTHMFDEKIVKGFNTTTMSKLANSELSALAKTASTVATMTFLISDNYNMVMLKSNGNNPNEANQKGKERFIQEMSRFFWQQMFINLFNNTFSHVYNASLFGASAVNTASTVIGEVCTRKAVGLPIQAASKQEIEDLERKNFEGDGIKSKFFRFMSKLTGKQILSERETKNKK